MKAPVYLYYELANFYQNHRRYVKSRSDKQLAGTFYTESSQLSDCDPLRTLNGKLLNPCGLIANSVFNGACHLSHRHTVQCSGVLAATGGNLRCDAMAALLRCLSQCIAAGETAASFGCCGFIACAGCLPSSLSPPACPSGFPFPSAFSRRHFHAAAAVRPRRQRLRGDPR